jgi:hypothetical protein
MLPMVPQVLEDGRVWIESLWKFNPRSKGNILPYLVEEANLTWCGKGDERHSQMQYVYGWLRVTKQSIIYICYSGGERLGGGAHWFIWDGDWKLVTIHSGPRYWRSLLSPEAQERLIQTTQAEWMRER